MSTPQSIILFDGICTLCNRCIQFIIKHDKKAHFYFSSLQGNVAEQLLQHSRQDAKTLSSIVLFERGKVFTKSDAVLKIVLKLNGLYPLLYGFIIIPRPIRNWIYDLIARNRYKWFGKRDTCMVPDEEIKARFI